MNKPLFALGVSLFLLGIGMLYGVSVVAQTSNFDACIAQYAAGESGWCKVSDDTFGRVRLTDAEATEFGVRGFTGSRAVMIAWTGAALDPDNLIMYFFGGGHNDYYGNEWYAYDIKAGQFERLNDPSRLTHYYFDTTYNSYCRVPDPAVGPISMHTYDGVQFNPDTGTIFILNQSSSSACGGQPSDGIQIERSALGNIYEFNPSKTDARNGLQPLTYRAVGKHNYSYPRSAFRDGKLILGSMFDLYEYTFVDYQAVRGTRIINNLSAGQGYADELNGEIVTYLNAGYLYTIGNTVTRHMTGNRISNSGGMACGVTECLFWSGNTAVSKWERETPSTSELIEHEYGPTGGDSRVYSKIQYIPQYDVYVGVSNVNQPVWLYKVAGTAPPEPEPEPNPGVVVEATTSNTPDYDLSINVEGTGPYSVGVGIPKGATATPNHPNAQTVCRVRWNDGSCKFAVVSSGPQGADPVDISVEINGAVVRPGDAYYTERGPYMVESWHEATVGDLLVLFYVQRFSGAAHVTVAIENGYLNRVTEQADYSATVTVGEQSKTHQITQPRNTRWVAEIYEGDFAIARQDVAQLTESGLVPDYPLSPNATPGSYQSYAPMQGGNHTAAMGATGYQPQIGLLPKWDAAYLANPSDQAFDSVVANAYAIGSYRIAWRDYDTKRVIEPEKFRRWTVAGDGQGGVNQVCANGLCWERAHFPSTGYLAYLLTGNPVHLDTLAHTAALCYLVQTWGYGGGEGEQRIDADQTRGQAWCWRAAGMYTALSGESGLKDRLAYNMSYYNRVHDNELGISYDYGGYGEGVTAPWQHNFRVQTLGFLSDIEPLDDMSDLIALRDFNYKFPVGLLRDPCRAGAYTLTIGTATSWDQVSEGSCTELSNPTATNYYANLLPAISYAVKHDAEGAFEAWGRVRGANNFDTWMASFDTNPVWGVAFPEQFSEPEPDPEPEPLPIIEVDTVCSNSNWRVFVDGVQLSQTFQRETTMADAMNNALFQNPGAVVTSSLNVTCQITHRAN